MSTSFSKYQATGNDFILIDGLDAEVGVEKNEIKSICDRHFGIGADGLIIAKTSEKADFFMDYYNSDGSFAEICGNGVRALAAFLIDEDKASAGKIKIDTRAGIKDVDVADDMFTVNMGKPSFDKEKIGFTADEEMWEYPIEIDDAKLEIFGVSIGNPHCIIFTENIDTAPVKQFGPKIENYKLFKNKINVEWVQVEGPDKLKVKIWERGAGYTLACGTGACASLAVANRKGLSEKRAIVSLPGGELKVEFRGNSLHLTGEAKLVFKGSIEL